MSTHIFADQQTRSKNIKPTHLLLHLRRIVCGAKDSIDALSAFKKLIDGSDPESKQVSLLDFDAHCGDCACQLRPVALHQILVRASEQPDAFIADIDKTIGRLEELHTDTLDVHRKLCDQGQTVDKLVGHKLSGNGLSREEFYGLFGMRAWFDELDRGATTHSVAASRSGSVSSSDSDSSSSHPSEGCPTPELVPTAEFGAMRLEVLADEDLRQGGGGGGGNVASTMTFEQRMKNLQDADFFGKEPLPAINSFYTSHRRVSRPLLDSRRSSYSVASSRTSSISRASSSDVLAVTSAITAPAWDTSNWYTIVQFIVFSYMLGRYKQVQFGHGDTAFTYRLSPQAAMERHLERDGDDLTCRFRKGPHKCQFKKRDDSWRVIDVEMAAMQTWITSISTRLVESLSFSDQLPHTLWSAAIESVRRGPRSIWSVPTFLSFVPVRQYWFDNELGMYLVVQRFCGAGYHLNFFRVQHDGYEHSEDDIKKRRYTVSIASDEDVDSSSEQGGFGGWRNEMHVCCICNSVSDEVEKDADALVRLMTSDNERARPHEDATCADNVEHVRRILESDVNEIMSTFFAQHCNYPFPVNPVSIGEGERASQVEPLVYSLEKNGLSDWPEWHADLSSRSEKLGSSYGAMHLCVPQHMFADTPTHLARTLRERHGRGQRAILPGFLQAVDLEQ